MKNRFMIVLTALISCASAQNTVADFENFNLAPASYYSDTSSIPFQAGNASFEYIWTKGSFAYWSGGFSYTNVYDSSTAGFTNLYGVKALKGNNNSNVFVVGKDRGTIRLSAPQTTVAGFYVTNTTYAYHSIRFGDSFTRKFGDTTGTNSPTTTAQGSYPDFFKLTVKGFKNGVMKSDSVEFYLADYRSAQAASDYVIKDWNFVNTATLGEVDSIRFFMYSSVFNEYGALTPLFFGLDDFTTMAPGANGISEMRRAELQVFPQPFTDRLYFRGIERSTITIYDMSGRKVLSREFAGSQVSLDDLPAGAYLMQVKGTKDAFTTKIIKSE